MAELPFIRRHTDQISSGFQNQGNRKSVERGFSPSMREQSKKNKGHPTRMVVMVAIIISALLVGKQPITDRPLQGEGKKKEE